MPRQQQSVALFRRRLESVIDRSGETTAGFARRAGIDRSTLAQLLDAPDARLPRADTLIAIAEVARVSVDWLLGLSQREEIGAAIIEAMLQIEEHQPGPVGDQFTAWLNEADGFRIRTVPVGLPDFVKTATVLRFEYGTTLDTAVQLEAVRARLDYMVRADHDVEVCVAIQRLAAFAAGRDVWEGLRLDDRLDQLEHLAEIYRAAYPGLRLYLYDLRTLYSAAFTVFGPKRAVLFLGPSYLVLNSSDHIRLFARRFDDIIRNAVAQPHEIDGVLRRLISEARSAG